jgi:LacI family transcriptional regulator
VTTAPKATMMDVAAKAGVSQATVSLVMNDSQGVRLSEATRRRVLEAAQELGYELVKRGPRQTTTDKTIIGFVVDEISTDPWMALAFDGVREKAWEFGLTVNLAVTRGDKDMEDQVLGMMCQQPILGLIYGTILTRRIKPAKALFDHPSVLLNCYDEERRLPSVVPGDLLGGRTATERLLQSGHRRIGLITGQTGVEGASERLRGYRQALASKDIGFDPTLVHPGNWQPDSGYAGTKALMALADPPTAIFCANDLMALGCLDALKELGLAIPGDVAVIGFDDREVSQYTRPPLTTLILPHYEMGANATEILVDRANRMSARPEQLKVECHLVERLSVGAIADEASG